MTFKHSLLYYKKEKDKRGFFPVHKVELYNRFFNARYVVPSVCNYVLHSRPMSGF